MDTMFFAERPIGFASVNLVCQNPFRIVPEAFDVFFHNLWGFGCFAFVVGIEAEFVYEGIASDNTDRLLCTEPGRSFGFASYYRPDPRLGKTYDPVRDPVGFYFYHLFLLFIENRYCKKPGTLYVVEAVKTVLRSIDLEISKVSVDASQLVTQLCSDLFRRFSEHFVSLRNLRRAIFLYVLGFFLPSADPKSFQY